MLSDIIANLKDKIVIIKNPNRSTGTGIVLDANGLIVTNSHVVSGCKKVGIETNAGKAYLGKVVKSDASVDFAFVICPDIRLAGFPVLSKRDAILEGEDVVAIGHPYGYDFTVTKGIISAAKRELHGVRYIQTDVPINPGNSGGPLIDEKGEILGINTWIVSNAQNIAFAIPSSYLINAYRELPSRDELLNGSYCPACGHLSMESAQFCKACGAETKIDPVMAFIYENTGFCTKCDTQNDPVIKYCSRCGAMLFLKANAETDYTAATVDPNAEITCAQCGTLNKGKKYCSKCGAALKA